MAVVEIIVEISKALLTPTIAAIGAYIAWQQWKGNQLKLKLDRYDRRLRIYSEVKKVLSIVARDAAITTDELLRFRSSVAEADFLFGPEITKYIDELYKRGLNLWRCNTERGDHPAERSPNYDHQKNVEETHAELGWFLDQFEPARSLFRRYLDLND